MNSSKMLLKLGCAALLFGASMQASTLITVDEYGHGLPYQLGPDPGPGGLPSTLIYSLPFTGVAGDVELIDTSTGIPADVIRFNGDGTLIYYSAGTAANTPALADEPRPPFPVSNTIQINENTSGEAFYTPTSGDPGYDATALPSYEFLENSSASAVPEPASVGLVLASLAGLLIARRRRSSAI